MGGFCGNIHDRIRWADDWQPFYPLHHQCKLPWGFLQAIRDDLRYTRPFGAPPQIFIWDPVNLSDVSFEDAGPIVRIAGGSAPGPGRKRRLELTILLLGGASVPAIP